MAEKAGCLRQLVLVERLPWLLAVGWMSVTANWAKAAPERSQVAAVIVPLRWCLHHP
ncbi:hypothetical protein QJS66_14325 [Kocuria rhizophila]|nr:hypothetical protein QJS66_14325 [Kocuria rhizophila]